VSGEIFFLNTSPYHHTAVFFFARCTGHSHAELGRLGRDGDVVRLGAGTTRIYRVLFTRRGCGNTQLPNALMSGLGGASKAAGINSIIQTWPSRTAEIDPVVVRVAKDYSGSRNRTQRGRGQTGRGFMRRGAAASMVLIFLDCL